MVQLNNAGMLAALQAASDRETREEVVEVAISAYLKALGDAPYRSRPGTPYTADRIPVLDPEALESAASAFPAGGTTEGAAEAIVSAYLAALPAPEKPARVEPKNNPNKKRYVDFQVRGGEWTDKELRAVPRADHLTVPNMVRGVDALCALTHTASFNAGWYTDPKTGMAIERNVGEVIALMHSELSEALEGYRKGLMDDHLPHRLQIEVEFADTVIRIADTCGHLGLDLAGAIVDKMRYNATREDHKLEARANGGKSF